MEVILGCCAGLDVHKDSVEACVRRTSAGGKVEHEVRHWGTTTRELVEMAEWLSSLRVTHVAMESTGVYWKPIFNILEEHFTKGSRWLRQALAQAAWAASHKKDSYFQAHAHNLMRRRGRKRGLVAAAHSLLIVIYHILKEGTLYRDLGPHFLDRTRAPQLIRFHVRRLQQLGMQVAVTPAAA